MERCGLRQFEADDPVKGQILSSLSLLSLLFPRRDCACRRAKMSILWEYLANGHIITFASTSNYRVSISTPCVRAQVKFHV